jgi:hypothetical protein
MFMWAYEAGYRLSRFSYYIVADGDCMDMLDLIALCDPDCASRIFRRAIRYNATAVLEDLWVRGRITEDADAVLHETNARVHYRSLRWLVNKDLLRDRNHRCASANITRLCWLERNGFEIDVAESLARCARKSKSKHTKKWLRLYKERCEDRRRGRCSPAKDERVATEFANRQMAGDSIPAVSISSRAHHDDNDEDNEDEDGHREVSMQRRNRITANSTDQNIIGEREIPAKQKRRLFTKRGRNVYEY